MWYVDWISVNGETDGDAEGMGDGRVSVGITHGQGTRDTSAATITFIYYDVDTGEEVGRKVVNVCRCICGCEYFEVTDVQIIPNCSCEDFEVIDVQITPTCLCEVLTTSQDSASWVWNKKGDKTITVNATDSCIDFSSISITIVGDNKDHFNVSSVFTEDTRRGTIIVSPKEYNTDTENNLTAQIVISYSSGSKPSCEKKIQLNHNKMVCNCDNFDVINVINPYN